MKNIVIIAIFVMSSISFGSFAQDASISEKFFFGVKAGANYANVYDTQGEQFNADAKLGFAGGIFMGIPIGKYFGIQPEALFSQKGFKAMGTVLGNSYEIVRTTNYLDIPLLVAIKPIEFVTILAGPQFSYLLSRKDEFKNSLVNTQQEQDFANDNIRKNTFCFLGGIDINLKQLVLGARVGWDIQRNNGDGSSTTPRYKNVWYQATIGYRLYSK